MTSRPRRQSPRAVAPAPLPSPELLRPMLSVAAAEAFDSPDYIFEVKWGGVRAIAVIEDGRVRLHGRNLRDLTPLYPELATLPRCLDAHSAVIDGEIAAWGTESLPDFELLRPRLLQPSVPPPARRPSAIIYQVFDLLQLDGAWLLDLPLYERRNLLHQRLRPNRAVQVADFVRDEGLAFFEAVRSHGLAGVVAKHKYSAYVPGERSPSWVDIRAFQADDFVIGGYSFGGGRRKDPIASLLLGAFRAGRLDFVGQVSVGCSDREARQLLDLLQPLHAEACPFREAPQVSRFLYWCRPELACHVRYGQWAADGQLRFPVFVAPRPDVPAEECVAP